MNDTAANDEFDDELLSAYLDGELASDERALVEERLRTDPRAKRLLEEMRAMSSAIKALPAVKLPRDLRAGVWEETARSPIAGRVTLATREERWAGFRRGLVWSAITIAAALMLMFLQPQPPQEGEVAEARRKEKTELSAKAEAKDRAVRGLDDVPKLSAPPEKRALLSSRGGTEASSPPPAGAETDDRPAAAVAASAPRSRDAEESIDADAATSSLAEAPPAPGPLTTESSEIGAIAQGGVMTPAAPPTEVEAAAAPGDSQVRLRSADEPAAQFGMADALYSDLKGEDKAALELRYAEAAPTQLVELVTAAPEASARFDELLAKNGIELQAEPWLKKANGVETRPTPRSREDVAEEESVLVVASPEQIAGLIADCQADAQLFAAVSEVDRGENKFAERGKAEGGKERGAAGQGGFGGGFREAPEAKDREAGVEMRKMEQSLELLRRQGAGVAWRLQSGMEEYKRRLALGKQAAGGDELGAFRRYAQPREEAAAPTGAAPDAAEQPPGEPGEARADFGESARAAETPAPARRVLFVLRPREGPQPAGAAKAAE